MSGRSTPALLALIATLTAGSPASLAETPECPEVGVRTAKLSYHEAFSMRIEIDAAPGVEICRPAQPDALRLLEAGDTGAPGTLARPTVFRTIPRDPTTGRIDAARLGTPDLHGVSREVGHIQTTPPGLYRVVLFYRGAPCDGLESRSMCVATSEVVELRAETLRVDECRMGEPQASDRTPAASTSSRNRGSARNPS